MVHALKEIWRVLKPGSSFVDLRPLAANSPVQVVAGRRVSLAGRIDDSRDRLDDIAVEKALTQVINEGRFELEREEIFNYISYWDTPDEMKLYIEQKRSSLVLPETVLVNSHRLLTGSGAGARLRIPFKMVIARYRKLQPPPQN